MNDPINGTLYQTLPDYLSPSVIYTTFCTGQRDTPSPSKVAMPTNPGATPPRRTLEPRLSGPKKFQERKATVSPLAIHHYLFIPKL